MYRVLLVDDDMSHYLLIHSYNQKMNTNYEINHLDTGVGINSYLQNNKIDLILMDWQLSNSEDGLNIIKELKNIKCYNHIPMILVTGKSELSDQIQGLNEGADDYITKPLSMPLLFSKINSFLRKENKDKNTEENVQKHFIFADDKLEVEFSGVSYKLSLKEFTILKILVNNPLKVHSQNELNELTSGKDVHVSKRCIDTFITLLRKKIGKKYILTIRKKGYKINDELLKALSLNNIESE